MCVCVCVCCSRFASDCFPFALGCLPFCMPTAIYRRSVSGKWQNGMKFLICVFFAWQVNAAGDNSSGMTHSHMTACTKFFVVEANHEQFCIGERGLSFFVIHEFIGALIFVFDLRGFAAKHGCNLHVPVRFLLRSVSPLRRCLFGYTAPSVLRSRGRHSRLNLDALTKVCFSMQLEEVT